MGSMSMRRRVICSRLMGCVLVGVKHRDYLI